jgi:hypothetical protein
VHLEPNGYAFVPFSVRSHSCVGKPALKILHDLGNEVAGPGKVTGASFVAVALREVSIGRILEIISCVVLVLERCPG